jgi:hypothetical protein
MDVAVGLVRAYLELCGYFVLAELPVPAAERGGYREVTDLDVIAVRFPHLPVGAPGRARRPLDLFLGTDPALGTAEEGVDVLIGEVKEGPARLNPALRRADTVAFALRRVGCCPEEQVESAAGRIVAAGERGMLMPGRIPCRVRVVAFAGRGQVQERGIPTIELGHCAVAIAERLEAAREVLAAVRLRDPVLQWFQLQQKVGRPAVTEHAQPAPVPRRDPAAREGP